MMPTDMPVLSRSPVRLRAFADTDTGLVRSMAGDPYVPLITTVPTSGTLADALAFIARQHDRLASGRGYSFAIADEASDAAVGQVGLWVDELPRGRASIGYWMSPAARRRGYVTAALAAVSDWGLSLDGFTGCNCSSSPGTRAPGWPPSEPATSARACCAVIQKSAASTATCTSTACCAKT